jgi:hypothetical protein
MYKDGWWLAMMMPRIPWDATPDTMRTFAPGVWAPDRDPAQLYHLPEDFTQTRDLAAEHPDKVAELKELFWAEAERYKVLPLLGGMSVYCGIIPPLPTQSRFTFYGDVQNVASGMIPRIYNHSYTISAELQVLTAAPRACWWPRPTTWAASRCSSTTASCSTPTR